MQSRERGVARLLGDLAAVDALLQVRLDLAETRLDQVARNVVEVRVEAGRSRDVRNAVAHGAGADDEDVLGAHEDSATPEG